MEITSKLGLKSFLGVPIFYKNGELYGNLCCFDIDTYSFSEEDVELLQTMSSLLTYVIELEKEHTQVKTNYERLFHENDLILTSLSEGVFGIDLKGNITFCNPSTQKILNCSNVSLIGDTPFQSFLRHEIESSPFMDTLKDGETRTRKDQFFCRNEEELFPVEYTTKAIYEADQITGMVVTFKDITERKKSEEMMVKSEKLTLAGQLAAGIAHEIRNPLTAIKGFLQMIEAGYQKDSYIKIMASELARVEVIVSELLLLAKPQETEYVPQEMGPLLQDVISVLNTQAILKNIEITLSEHKDELLVNGDANQMKQVFINLIKNAIEALPSGGRICVKPFRKDSTIVILVQDNGVGIPEEKLEQLGQPFYSTKEDGTGLGLMVSFNIIQNHNGHVHVSSIQGEGTTFEVVFPSLESR